MALNAAAAAIAAEAYIVANYDSYMTSRPLWTTIQRPAIKAQMTALITAIYAGIVASGVVVPTALVAPNGAVTGVGNIT